MKKILTVLSAVFLFGCVKQGMSLNGEYVLIDAPSNAKITISFDGNNFAGSAGVNRYFGIFEQKGDNIKLNAAGTTMMMGPEDLMQTEQKYLQDLSRVNKILLKNNVLSLIGDNDVKLEFIIK